MPKRNVVWIAAIVIAGVVTVWVTRRSQPSPADITPSGLKPVVRTYHLIEDRYYGPLDQGRLQRKAIGGMVSALDEFSSYIPPEKLDSFKRHMAGKDRGVGLRLEMVDGRVMVVGPLLNSPAHRAKVYAGDQILAVDGQDVDGLELADVELLLEGALNSRVVLTVMRRAATLGFTTTLSITLTRGEFPMETVTGLCRGRNGQWAYYLPGEKGIAYVRITEFVEDTGNQFQSICRKLGRPRGLVLDLRDNPGGYLKAAVSVADMFLTRGVIMTEVQRTGQPQHHLAHAEGTYQSVPVVVQINSRTASAGEIVAGALSTHGRAVLVGTRTRGKHCVQTMYPLGGDLGQVNLTTSRFLIGVDISALPARVANWSVDPHVEVALSAPERRELRRLRTRAEVVPSPVPVTGPATEAESPAPPPIARQIVKMDPQLVRAIKLLRAPLKMDAILRKAAAKKTPTTVRVRVRSVPAKRHD